jgi:2,3-bisphosphoglycerate-independent phosphoglycerate mutase
MSLLSKGLLIILDGLGDRPCAALGSATPLEAAHTPNMDRLAEQGLCGQMDPLMPGLPVGTHTGMGLLMGLAPSDATRLSRGPVEAAGIGLPMNNGDVVLRSNFATLLEGKLVDRRAGRIDEGTEELAKVLADIDLGDGITGSLRPTTQHRGVLHLRGEGLSPQISDTDPGSGKKELGVLRACPLDPENTAAARTAAAVNRFVALAGERLSAHEENRRRLEKDLLPANAIITRSAGHLFDPANLVTHMGLSAAVVTGESTVEGLARLFGFDVLREPGFTALPDTDLSRKAELAHEALEDHDLVFLHVKGPDICAHDYDPGGKRDLLARIDQAFEELLRGDWVIGITGDHSTESHFGRHCGDPVPSLLRDPHGRIDRIDRFGEKYCMEGGLGRLSATAFLSCLLDAMGATHNFRCVDARYLRTA